MAMIWAHLNILVHHFVKTSALSNYHYCFCHFDATIRFPLTGSPFSSIATTAPNHPPPCVCAYDTKDLRDFT